MNIPYQKHIEFYEWQIQVEEDEWKRYANTKVQILIQEKELFVGRIWGIQENQGNVVLRFKAGAVPRMKQPYILCLVGAGAPLKSKDWDFTYEEFRSSSDPRLSGLNSDIYTLNYLKSDDEKWSYALVTGIDASFLSMVKERYLDHNNHPVVVVAKTDPPIDYLKKLKEFVVQNEDDPILKLDVTVKESDWAPIYLDNKESITNDVIKLIDNHTVTIIQGPPGTGKSYLAVEICNYFIDKNQSICVTALTNKALMEIAVKEGLQQPLQNGLVFKTNLSSDEAKKLINLRPVESFVPKQGELLLSTYYKLSQKQSELASYGKRFDLVVIEEASQSYLATIAMFSSIAKKILIIGDHKQLTPVVKRIDEAMQIHENIEGVINGLQTYAFNNNSISYRLINTRRLTSDGAKMTGLFYNNSLKSISKVEGGTKFNSNYFNLFHPNGGVSIAKLSSSMTGFTQKSLLKFICLIAREILMSESKIEVALLTPYIDLESKLYEQYSRLTSDYSRITINTIHKIQGLTADVTILYLPLDAPSFDLDANLFNVGTSRATRGTLIVTYHHVDLVSHASVETMHFIHRCMVVTEQFNARFSSMISYL